MGPWSADLPDVSPPEKQPACQRGRLFKHTLRRASLRTSSFGAEAPVLVRYDRLEKRLSWPCGCRDAGCCSLRRIFGFGIGFFILFYFIFCAPDYFTQKSGFARKDVEFDVNVQSWCDTWDLFYSNL